MSVFTLSRITHEYDLSINNAPLIIARLLKGEWQSFPSSRGERGLCASFTFWKVQLSPSRFAYHFLSIKPVNFLCCGKLSNPVRARCISASRTLPPRLFCLNLQENECMTSSLYAYILFKCVDGLHAIHTFNHSACIAQRFSPHATCLLVCLSSITQQVSRSAFPRRALSTFSADHIIHGNDWARATDLAHVKTRATAALQPTLHQKYPSSEEASKVISSTVEMLKGKQPFSIR